MSIIRLKRSGTTGSPGGLAQGELAYSWLTGTQANGGDRLYIGTGSEIGSNAANMDVIGGKYFTDKLDHVAGTLTAESAIIVDASSKIDVLNIDNLTIDGNSITSTNTDGDITLNPDGTGVVNVSTSRITNVTDPSGAQDAATKAYVDSVTGNNVSFTISADVGGTDLFKGSQTLTFTGDTGITTTVANNSITIDLDDTAVTPAAYGSSTAIPVITIDQQGRITNATTAALSTSFTLAADAGSNNVFNTGETLYLAGDTGITTTVANNQVLIDLDDTAVTPAAYGSSTAIPVITIDQQGRITNATTAALSTSFTLAADAGSNNVFNTGETLYLAGDTGITTTVANNQVLIDLDDTAVTPAAYGSSTAIPVITIDQQGRITNATTAAIDTTLDIAGDTGSDTVNGGETLTFTGGTGVDTTVADNQVTFDIGQDVSTTANVTFSDVTVNGTLRSDDITASQVVISGNLVVQGTTTTVNSNEVEIGDSIIILNANTPSVPTENAGIEIERGDSANKTLIWDETADKWTVGSETFVAGTFEGALTGNADTATALATSRVFYLTGDVVAANVAFDGSGNVNLVTTIQPNSVALGNDTTGDYVATVSANNAQGITASGTGEGASVVISASDATDVQKGVATFDETNFTVTAGDVTIAEVDGGTY